MSSLTKAFTPALLLGAALVTTTAAADDDVVQTITVTGMGTVTAAPDMATVAVGVVSQAETAEAALEQGWLTERGIARSVPSAGPDESLMEWLGRLLRLSVSPAAARAILEFGATIDVRTQLADVQAPTLVLHRAEDQWVDPANGRYLAEHIPSASLVELPGADHWPWFGDSESVLRPVEAQCAA